MTVCQVSGEIQSSPTMKRLPSIKSVVWSKKADNVAVSSIDQRHYAINTKVETNNGNVTLYGKASNAAESNLATKLANDVNGVKV